MTTIHTPYGDLRVDGHSEPLSWGISTEIPGLVIDDRRIALTAVHDLTRAIELGLWDYAYSKQRHGGTGMRRDRLDRLTDPGLFDTVDKLVEEVSAELRRRLHPAAQQVTEIVVDGLSSERQAHLAAHVLRREFNAAGDTKTVTPGSRHVLVTGAPEDEDRVVRAMLEACVPCSVHARTATRIHTQDLPPEVFLGAVTHTTLST